MNEHPMVKDMKRHRKLMAAVAEASEIHARIEIPTDMDKKRAAELLRTLTSSNFKEMMYWKGNPKQTLIKIKVGEGEAFVSPHKFLNGISITFGLHWDAGRECYV